MDNEFQYPGFLEDWDLSEIREADADRAETLDNAEPADSIIESVRDALESCVESDDVRFGWEQASANPDDCRAVVQFSVSSRLFDSFFNAKTGYRAWFRASSEIGLKRNCLLIERLKKILEYRLENEIHARHLNPCFEDLGGISIQKPSFLSSLDPVLSKVWFCSRLIAMGGGVSDIVSGAVGPGLLVGDKKWAALYRTDTDAWLDLKGAFNGNGKLYQPKSPQQRAEKLHTSGEA